MQQLKSTEDILYNIILYEKSINNICLTLIISIYNSIKRYAVVAEILISQLISFNCRNIETFLLQLISDYSIWNFVGNHKIASNEGIFS